jgi:predicted N-acetyltransferase YhbS
MSPTIRSAEPRDIEAAGQICRRVLAEKKPYNYELNIGLEGCLNLVAEEDGAVVGFVTVLLSRWDPAGRHLWQRLAPYLAFVGVLPEYQGHGIGASLVRAALREAAFRCPGEPRMFLEHAPDNRARRLYSRLGFRTLSADEIVSLTGLTAKGPVMCLEFNHALGTASDGQ